MMLTETHVLPVGTEPAHRVGHGFDCWCEPDVLDEGVFDSKGRETRMFLHRGAALITLADPEEMEDA
jgi:hypothetical protein